MIGTATDKASLDATLEARGKLYGEFSDNAEVAQRIKDIFREQAHWPVMTWVQRQALDVIADKISRVVTGSANYRDNWHDIQGYAKLAEDRLPEGR